MTFSFRILATGFVLFLAGTAAADGPDTQPADPRPCPRRGLRWT